MSEGEKDAPQPDSNLSNEALQNRIKELEEENKNLRDNCNNQTENSNDQTENSNDQTGTGEQKPIVSVDGTLQFDKDRDYLPLDREELENNGKRKLKEGVDTTKEQNLLLGLDYKEQFRGAYKKYIKKYLTLQLKDGYQAEEKEPTDDFPTEQQIDFLIGIDNGAMFTDITERDPIPLDILRKSNEILMKKEFMQETTDLIKKLPNFKIEHKDREKTIVIGVDDSDAKQAVLLLPDGKLKFINSDNTPILSLSDENRFMIIQKSGNVITGGIERIKKKPLDLDKVDIKEGEEGKIGFILKFTGTKATGGKRKTKKKKSNKRKRKSMKKRKSSKSKKH